jgi:Zinc knuckle
MLYKAISKYKTLQHSREHGILAAEYQTRYFKDRSRETQPQKSFGANARSNSELAFRNSQGGLKTHRGANRGNGNCFKCNKPGHYIRQCPEASTSDVVHYLSVLLSDLDADFPASEEAENIGTEASKNSDEPEESKRTLLSEILVCSNQKVPGRVGPCHGCFLDTAAQGSVTGLNQYNAYLKHMTLPHPKLLGSTKTFRFGNSVHKSLGGAPIRFWFSESLFCGIHD